MKKTIAIFTAVSLMAPIVLAKAKPNAKGLLPELAVTGDNETLNDQKALSSEVMITRAENRAIQSIQEVIKKSKGKPNEPDLYYRLAELYMKRSKSGRFFDLHRNTPLLKLSPFPVPNERGLEAVRRAVKIYTKIEASFPKYHNMDAVYFNNAFANQQLGQARVAQVLYSKLIQQFPKSPLIADGTLALGELYYDEGKFQDALSYFLKLNKNSRVYSYGMYKAAWAYYNLRDSDNAVKKLIDVVKSNPPLEAGEIPGNRHNLRREALRDLTIFIGDSYPADELYAFFKKITTEDELGSSMIDLAKLYDSHSRQKEMNIFLGEYIKKNPDGSQVVKAHLYLLQANETLKNRDAVIAHLEESSKLCGNNSSWKKEQKIEVYEESCLEGFRKQSLEVATKWWDIWLKNKKNTDFANLTQKLFKIILDNEDPKKPDYKTRFAYAELLFQVEKFDEATEQYKLVTANTPEPKLKHDAAYGALYSKEKSIEKGTNPLKEGERKELAEAYLKAFPTGAHAPQVQFKLGHIAYMEGQYDQAEKILKPISESTAKNKESKDLAFKSEDLLLDILNIRKDFVGIKNYAKKIVKTASGDRKAKLDKIMVEAHYTEIQEFAKSGDKNEASAKLLQFADEHKNSNLSQDALWQALSLEYAQGNLFQAAELSLKFTKKFPNDKRNSDALKEAANAYISTGQLQKAADSLVAIALEDKKVRNKNLELAADIYTLNEDYKNARLTYDKLLEAADGKTTERIYGKLLESFKKQKDEKQALRIKNQILSKGIEPYTTQIMISRAREALSQGNLKSAFDQSLKANNRDVSADVRAEARLIQSEILEKELVAQSVKAREDKFATVMALKTEKLDKAHTAYLSTLKMAKDPAIQLAAMEGIDRCYGNYIESLSTMPLPASLSPEDQKTLREELAKIIAPIHEKKVENATRLKSVAASLGKGNSGTRSIASLPVKDSFAPAIDYPKVELFKPYLPANENYASGKVGRATGDDRKLCNKTVIASGKYASINIFKTAASCLSVKNFDNLENFGLELAKEKKFRTLGLFYASVGSEGRGNTDKALWLIEAALKEEAHSATFIYQKARLLYEIDGITAAIGEFSKALNLDMTSPELKSFAGVKAYTEGNYIQAAEDLSSLSREDLIGFNVGITLSEAHAQKGDTEKALAVVKELLKQNKNQVEFLLQQAHLFETYKLNPDLALESYEKAMKVSSDNEIRNWLSKKIEVLKSKNKVGQHVYQGDL